jgi:polar amino acid transport system substrate-binding protein
MVDCLAVDIGVAKFHLNSSNGKFVQLSENLSSEQYAIGFKKGNTTLRDEVQNVVSEMWKDGTFLKIANQYADYSLPDMICIGDYVK